MISLLKTIIDALAEGERLCLATIIRRLRSAPRGLGAKCLMGKKDILWGSVGGGALESEVVSRSGEVREKGLPQILQFRLDNTDVAKEGMLCGGEVDIFLEPILPGHESFWTEAHRVLLRGEKDLWIVTQMDPEGWSEGRLPKCLISKDGILLGGLTGIHLEEVLWGEGLQKRRCLWIWRRPSKGSLLIEPIRSSFRLIIFGAGHIGRYLAQIGHMLEFEVLVYDDREEFLDPKAFPPDTLLIKGPFRGTLRDLKIEEGDFITIATRGHLNDMWALEQVLQASPAYVGMIGSKRKREQIFGYLKEKGFSEETLSQVHSPIGLEIGAETPQEIAVSIMAEIIQVKSRLFS